MIMNKSNIKKPLQEVTKSVQKFGQSLEETTTTLQEFEKTLQSFEPLPKDVAEFLTADGFCKAYQKLLKTHSSIESYNICEETNQRITGKRRYAEYWSFRSIFSRYLKKIRK